MAVGVLALLPLIYNEALPTVQAVALRLPSPAVSPPAAMKANPAPAHASSLVQRIFHQFEGHRFEAPRRIPDKISMPIDQPAAPELPAAGATGPDVAGGIRDSLIGAPAVPVAPPPKPALEKSAITVLRKPVPVGGQVQAAKLVKRVMPIYPQLARAARISGVVKLVGVIAKDGTIQQLQAVSGHPLLVRAALDAVRQWVYRPTLLNGAAVEVIAPIEVVFTLGE